MTISDSPTELFSRLDVPAASPADLSYSCGHSVALSENYVVFGCPGFKEFTNEFGAVIVYDRRGSLAGAPFLKLPFPAPALPAKFGSALSINAAGILAVGSGFGFVVLYNLRGERPDESFQTLGPDLTLDPVNDSFGLSVAINEVNFVAIGAIKQGGNRGSVFLYTNLNTAPVEIPAPSSVTDCDSDGCEFGFSVALFGNTLVVGAPGSNQKGGRAFVYKDVTAENFQDKVQSLNLLDNPLPDSEYGRSVAITNGTLHRWRFLHLAL